MIAFQDAPKEFYGYSFIPRVGFSFPSTARHVDAGLADTSSPMSAAVGCWESAALRRRRGRGGERKMEKWKS